MTVGSLPVPPTVTTFTEPITNICAVLSRDEDCAYRVTKNSDESRVSIQGKKETGEHSTEGKAKACGSIFGPGSPFLQGNPACCLCSTG